MNKPCGKIGLAVLGYSRPHYFKECLSSLQSNNWGGADVKAVFLDFKDEPTLKSHITALEAFKHDFLSPETQNIGVGKLKNKAFKLLLEQGCEHIFLMEDDILMLRRDTCLAYIEYAKSVGVEHLNFAHHGPANYGKKAFIEWRGNQINVHPNCIGAFSYYTRNCLNQAGLIDENFYNAWEHVALTFDIINLGLHPPFWYFADVPDSDLYLCEIPGSIEQSSIRPRADWRPNIEKGKEYWIRKYGRWLPPYPSEFW